MEVVLKLRRVIKVAGQSVGNPLAVDYRTARGLTSWSRTDLGNGAKCLLLICEDAIGNINSVRCLGIVILVFLQQKSLLIFILAII